MKGQKFSLCAYGDCTNPALAFKPGTISIDGKNGSVPPIGVTSITESIQTSIETLS